MIRLQKFSNYANLFNSFDKLEIVGVFNA